MVNLVNEEAGSDFQDATAGGRGWPRTAGNCNAPSSRAPRHWCRWALERGIPRDVWEWLSSIPRSGAVLQPVCPLSSLVTQPSLWCSACVSPVPCHLCPAGLPHPRCSREAVLLSLCPVLTSAAFPGFVCPWEPNPGTELPAHLTQTHLFVSTMLLSVFGSAETHRSGMDPPHVNVCCSPYFSISFYPGGTNAAGDIMVFYAGVLSVLATLVQRIFSFPLVLL